jgi:hypothetical protein
LPQLAVIQRIVQVVRNAGAIAIESQLYIEDEPLGVLLFVLVHSMLSLDYQVFNIDNQHILSLNEIHESRAIAGSGKKKRRMIAINTIKSKRLVGRLDRVAVLAEGLLEGLAGV